MTAQLTLLARICQEPVARLTPDGLKITALNLATNCGWGEKKTTQFWKGNIFGEKFAKVIPYLKKGGQVMVSGCLSRATSCYTSKQGENKVNPLEFSIDMLFLVGGDKESSSNSPSVHAKQDVQEEYSDLPF